MDGNIRIVDGSVQIVLVGKIYADEAIVLREALFPLIGKGHIRFRVDMAGLEYIDSSGLGILLAVQRRVVKLGGGVTVLGLQGDMRKLFELTRLTEQFKME